MDALPRNAMGKVRKDQLGKGSGCSALVTECLYLSTQSTNAGEGVQ